MARAFVAAVLLAALGASPAAQRGSGGADPNAVRSRVQQRFQILPLANGVLLTPRFKTTVRSIELTDDTIAVDGLAVTGGELRQKLGADANLIFEISYLDASARRSLAGAASPSVPGPATTDTAPPPPPAVSVPADVATRVPRPKVREAVVRIGGSVKIESDERVTDDVVVVGGSADIDGEVDGDVVVVGGSARFGPQADVRNDVTIVGGTLSQDPSAVIGGKVQNVGFGDLPWNGRMGDWRPGRDWRWGVIPGFSPVARFMGTAVRAGLMMLFAALVIFVARGPVEQIADRAAAEPLKAWLVGFLAQLLFGPVLVLTVVVLAISIVGIPLLVFVPVAIVGLIVVLLVGFTAVAYRVGQMMQSRVEQLRARPYLSTLTGIVLILSPLIVARIVGLTGQLGFVAALLVAVGVVIEYIAWTTGLGAAALVRFARPAAPPPQVV